MKAPNHKTPDQVRQANYIKLLKRKVDELEAELAISRDIIAALEAVPNE